MIIHFLRNATFVIQSSEHRILVDPMLGPPGCLPPYSVIRFKPRWNPIVPLPASAPAALIGITAGLLTHTHFGTPCDHLDRDGLALLMRTQVPVHCTREDQKRLERKGLQPVAVAIGEEARFFDGTIKAIVAAHGRGLIGKLMGRGVGYVIRLPDEPSVYITGDTVLTDEVKRVLEIERPDWCIVPCGGAQLDVGSPILMSKAELLEFIRLVPGHVLAIHLEALNHCPMSRENLRIELMNANLLERVTIPNDGESLTLERTR